MCVCLQEVEDSVRARVDISRFMMIGASLYACVYDRL